MAELPLAIFTTLAPIGAGAFIALAVAFFTTKFSDEQLKKIDRMTLVPLVFLIVGFIASFVHLTSPLNAINVFAGTGTSPLSNEIAVGSVFLVVAIVYWALAFAGKLNEKVRKVFIAIVALLALAFALFVGLAYVIPTIASWNTPLVPVQIVGFTLLGGMCLGSLVLALAGVLEEAGRTAFKTVVLILIVVGAALAVAALFMQINMVGSLENALCAGAALTGPMTPYAIGFAVCAVIAAVLGILAQVKQASPALLAVAVVLAVAGVFLARLVFYGIQLSIGL
ncbi:MAG: DmsC/YnfH family molybdoenzyme membrane anchor subunit, partial [Raoultibacter sp.]